MRTVLHSMHNPWCPSEPTGPKPFPWGNPSHREKWDPSAPDLTKAAPDLTSSVMDLSLPVVPLGRFVMDLTKFVSLLGRSVTELTKSAFLLGRFATNLTKSVSPLGRSVTDLTKLASLLGRSVTDLVNWKAEFKQNWSEKGQNVLKLPRHPTVEVYAWSKTDRSMKGLVFPEIEALAA